MVIKLREGRDRIGGQVGFEDEGLGNVVIAKGHRLMNGSLDECTNIFLKEDGLVFDAELVLGLLLLLLFLLEEIIFEILLTKVHINYKKRFCHL